MSGEVLAFPQAPDGVEVRHLRAFIAVAEELNFNRAATRLYLSQPALSRQIRALERLLGCELLRRSTHRVELTVAGSALLDRARRLLADLDEAIATTQSVGGELANRMATMWAPVLEVVAADRDIQETRIAYEAFLAQSPVPESISVRPVNAGGVSALALGAADQPDTPILYLHGGGYAVGSAYGYRPLVGALATAAGAGALVPDYRLAPEHPFPAALEDVLAAYRSVVGARVIVTGECAGGGLAIALAVAARDEGLALPEAIDVVSPFCDLTLSGASIDAPTGPDPWMNRHRLRTMAASYIHGADPADPRISPLYADLRDLPPLTIRAAAGEALADDARRLADVAGAADVDVSLELVEDSVHSFVLFGFLPEAQAALSPR